jgi:hypothetical protein
LSDAETVDSSLPTISVWKISQPLSRDGTDSEHSSIDISDSEISEQSDAETVDGWSTCDETPNLEPFLGNQGVNVAIGDSSDITQVVSTVTGDHLLQLFAEQSNLYHK